MVHFLRNNKNRSIIETDVFTDIEMGNIDLSSVMYVKEYSDILFNISQNGDINICEFIDDIDTLYNLRCWYWEELNRSTVSEDDINNLVAEKYIEIANKYNLRYVLD